MAVNGYVRLIVADPDGDYHIQLATGHTTSEARYPCLIVELPRPEEAFVSDASLRDRFANLRQYIKDRLLEGKEPSSKAAL